AIVILNIVSYLPKFSVHRNATLNLASTCRYFQSLVSPLVYETLELNSTTSIRFKQILNENPSYFEKLNRLVINLRVTFTPKSQILFPFENIKNLHFSYLFSSRDSLSPIEQIGNRYRNLITLRLRRLIWDYGSLCALGLALQNHTGLVSLNLEFLEDGNMLGLEKGMKILARGLSKLRALKENSFETASGFSASALTFVGVEHVHHIFDALSEIPTLCELSVDVMFDCNTSTSTALKKLIAKRRFTTFKIKSAQLSEEILTNLLRFHPVSDVDLLVQEFDLRILFHRSYPIPKNLRLLIQRSLQTITWPDPKELSGLECLDIRAYNSTASSYIYNFPNTLFEYLLNIIVSLPSLHTLDLSVMSAVGRDFEDERLDALRNCENLKTLRIDLGQISMRKVLKNTDFTNLSNVETLILKMQVNLYAKAEDFDLWALLRSVRSNSRHCIKRILFVKDIDTEVFEVTFRRFMSGVDLQAQLFEFESRSNQLLSYLLTIFNTWNRSQSDGKESLTVSKIVLDELSQADFDVFKRYAKKQCSKVKIGYFDGQLCART
ncbi:hypothetical protein HK098_006477, partial [Nowakowskiella sp. JEL0407]